jgi:hypothetical protein
MQVKTISFVNENQFIYAGSIMSLYLLEITNPIGYIMSYGFNNTCLDLMST